MHYLVSLGEPLLRLSPPKFERLRRAASLDVRLAGAEVNVAANLARLGRHTALVSHAPANELGLLARDACMSYGVDVSFLTLVPETRMGVVYVDFGVTPRVGVSVYDRGNSAASAIGPEDFPWTDIVAETRIAHTDGIFAGLSDSCREAALQFLTSARRAHCTTSFDVNYREHLWDPARARDAYTRLLPYVDVLSTNRAVAEHVFGFRGSDEEILGRYHAEFGCRVVCLTYRETQSVLRGAWSSIAMSAGTVVRGDRYEFDVVDRFGTGDAWFAGFLHCYFDHDLAYALRFGDALCALAHTTEGDVIQSSEEDVTALLAGPHDLSIRR